VSICGRSRDFIEQRDDLSRGQLDGGNTRATVPSHLVSRSRSRQEAKRLEAPPDR
jgi:hypothetical protein